MTDEDIVSAILDGDEGKIILGHEVETTGKPFRSAQVYNIVGGIKVRHTHIAYQDHPRGVPLNTMPKDVIAIIEPEERVIYKTDWIDELT